VPTISIVDYGVGNLRSVKKALEGAGAKPIITSDRKDLRRSDAIVLPGVGAFREAMKNLRPIAELLKQLAKDGAPTLGICLGLQLLFTRSFEGGNTVGLDLIKGDVIKLPDTVKLPHVGWNSLEIAQECSILKDIPDLSYVYFVHSYVPDPVSRRDEVAYTKYGVKFPSVVTRRNIFGTQFHPEKSSKVGLKILENFVSISKR
jgi:glutamine amidotransferase